LFLLNRYFRIVRDLRKFFPRVFSKLGVLHKRMDDDELRKRLALWEVRPEIPPDFQRNVWQKIAVRESKQPKVPWFEKWRISWLSAPQLATCAIVLGGVVGTGLGLVESSQSNSRTWKSLEAKYVQSVDPYEHLRTY
jgi:hypothetical protein